MKINRYYSLNTGTDAKKIYTQIRNLYEKSLTRVTWTEKVRKRRKVWNNLSGADMDG